MKDLANKQNEVEDFWNAKPCGSENSGKDVESRDYYNEIELERYQYQYHIPKIHDWLDWTGKNILEIGTGVGTDARQLIGRGANYTGINVDQGSVAATARALSVFDLEGRVMQCSATELVFDDESMDVVYSFGVLHHIPEVEKAVAEIQRVLKPGGELLIMLYNKSSINYQIEIRYLRRWALALLSLPGAVGLFSALGFPRDKLQRHIEIYRQFGKLGDQEWLNRNTDGPDNPYSLVYGEDDIRGLLPGFEILRNEVYYFEARHWGVLGKILPRSLVDALGRRWGWHRMVYARKATGS